MGNLGAYQKITTIAKRVGGPKNLLILMLVGGYAAGKGIEKGVKASVKGIKRIISKPNDSKEQKPQVYSVIKEATDNEGVHFSVGDTFTILEQDEDVILINVISDEDSPYYVSKEFLENISDFNNEQAESEGAAEWEEEKTILT